MKKPFKETKLGKFFGSVVNTFPDIAEVALEIATNPVGGLKVLNDKLKEKAQHDSKAQEMLLELQMEELEMQKELLDFEKNAMALNLEDTKDARDLQKTALQSDDIVGKRFVYFLSAFLVLGAFVFGVGLFFIEVPEKNQRLVEMFADIFVFGGAMTVVNFHLGNSYRGVFKGKASN